MFGITLKSGVILSCSVYDVQFFSVSIYKVGKRLMPCVSIRSDFKSLVVYTSLLEQQDGEKNNAGIVIFGYYFNLRQET